MNPDHVAQAAQLAMLIELSSSPKPGNVDRCHDFDEIEFRHFLISAVSSYPVFRKAASSGSSVGELILEAVKSWGCWGLEENTHFGSVTLLVPLAMAAGNNGQDRDVSEKDVFIVLENTTVQDSINFYAAFDLAGARVAEVEDLSLKDTSSTEILRREDWTLLDLMKLSQGHDLVAREWSTGFKRSFKLAEVLSEKVSIHGLNDGVVLTYLEALAEVPDSLVRSKFGSEKAEEVSKRAAALFGSDVDTTLKGAKLLDRDFVREDVNPGSTADLIASGLFIALVKGTILRGGER